MCVDSSKASLNRVMKQAFSVLREKEIEREMEIVGKRERTV